MEYNDDEKNAFSFELALELDNRTYWQYYISLLRTKHDLILAFYYDNNYNSKIIQMDLFLIGFSIEYMFYYPILMLIQMEMRFFHHRCIPLYF